MDATHRPRRLGIISPSFILIGATAWLVYVIPAALAQGRGSDVIRQWVVCQYVLAGTNPYSVAQDVLVATYGPSRPSQKIFAIPATPSGLEPRILREFGPPEATYPPPGTLLLTLTVGWIPNPRVVLVLWTCLNVLLVAALVYLIASVFTWPRLDSGNNRLVVLALVLAFTPTTAAIINGQFSLLIMCCLLIPCLPGVSERASGAAMGVALLKPSVALPFAAVAVARRQWRRVIWATLLQLTAWVGIAFWTRTHPLVLVSQWVRVSEYFMQPLYSLQELVVLSGLQGATAGRLVTLAMIAALALLGLWLRTSPEAHVLALTGVGAILWTYHGPYDFVLVIPALMLLMGFVVVNNESHERRGLQALGFLLFFVLSVALSTPVIRGDSATEHLARWMGRLSILALFILVSRLVLLTVRTTDQKRRANPDWRTTAT